MLHLSEYFFEGSTGNDISKINHISKINSAIDELETNILALRQGGKVSDIDLKPLPSQFFDDWNIIYQKWVSLKTTITENIIKPNEQINSAATTVDKVIKTTLETTALSLVDSSNALVTQLGKYAGNISQNSMFLQTIFALLNIAVSAVVLFIVMRILKPIYALTTATFEVTRGNLDVSVKSRGNDDEVKIVNSDFMLGKWYSPWTQIPLTSGPNFLSVEKNSDDSSSRFCLRFTFRRKLQRAMIQKTQ